MEHNLFKYVWRHSRAEQLVVLAVVLASMPFYFMSLDLPKDIVNRGIQGKGFEGEGSTQAFLAFDLPFGELLTGAPLQLFEGFQLDQAGLLLALSFVFLALVVVNGVFKLKINTMKGRLGERMLRRLRYQLADRVLRFPVGHSRKVKQAEVATMIKDEVEPLGGFIGDAFITPVFLGGQALTALAFILVQSLWLGLVAAAIVLLQAWIIPRLRRRILVLGKARQLTARQLAGRIGEIIDGATEVQAHDTSNWERADLSSRLGRIFHIRFEIYQRKFFVKFLNNFLSQLTPFIFYVVGGLLALDGQLDIGALVAVIAAYKDLPSPIKELIDWDQQRLDVTIKYQQVIEQFEADGMLTEAQQALHSDPVPALEGPLALSGLGLTDEEGNKRLEAITLTASLREHLALVGDSASGKDRLMQILAGLERPTAGSLKVGEQDLTKLPQWVTGRRLAYVGAESYHFPLSVRENLLYGLKHAPLRAPQRSGDSARRWAHEEQESRRAANPIFDVEADWIDRRVFAGTDRADEDAALLSALRLVDLEEDIYRFGLAATFDPGADAKLASALLVARHTLADRLQREGADDLVARFDPAIYNRQATLADNLLFATPTDPRFASSALAGNESFIAVLRETAVLEALEQMGLSIAKTMVELFADLPAGHPFFEQFSFIAADDLPTFKAMVARSDKGGLASLSDRERQALLALTFGYVEARHRLSLIDPALETKLLTARRALANKIAAGELTGLTPYDPAAISPAASVMENILFGRLVYGQAKAEDTVNRLVATVLVELNLQDAVMVGGLSYNVGVGGKKLSAVQRQKLALARALLKEADLLLVNDALAILDGASQLRILERVLQQRAGRGVVWSLTRAAAAEKFERVVLMDEGRIAAEGRFAQLNQPGSALARLVAAG